MLNVQTHATGAMKNRLIQTAVCFAMVLACLSTKSAHAATLSIIVTTPSTSTLAPLVVRTAQNTPGSRACPRGYRGRYPDCKRIDVNPPRKCPRGYVGRPPTCVRIVLPPPKACPRGYRGRYPKCRRMIADPPRACPRGYRGKRPNCKRIVADPPRRCKRGTYGTWPNCKRRPTQPQYDTKTATPKTGTRKRPKRQVGRSKSRKRLVKPGRTTRPAQRRATAALTDRRPNEIIVVLDRAIDVNAAFAIAQQYRLVRLEGQDVNVINARVQRYRIPDRRTVEDVLAEMQGDGRIRMSQPNYVYRLIAGATGEKKTAPKRKRILSTKAKLQYALQKLRIPQTHELATGRNVRIAVIDSGVDTTHTEFTKSSLESYNAARNSRSVAHTHGTSVVGVIGATGDLIGIAPTAKIIAIRAFAPEAASTRPITDSYVLVHALDTAHKRKARILNLSFAGPRDPLTEDVISAVQQAGVIVVAAAGNAGPEAEPVFPAAYSDVIAVTGTDKQDQIYTRANHGAYIAIAAPGVGVFAPIPKGSYDFHTGTSFAAPHVTGLIALMLERRPNLSARDVRTALTNTAVDLGPPGPDPMFGAGQVDARASVEAVIAGHLTEIARGVALPRRPSHTFTSD